MLSNTLSIMRKLHWWKCFLQTHYWRTKCYYYVSSRISSQTIFQQVSQFAVSIRNMRHIVICSFRLSWHSLLQIDFLGFCLLCFEIENDISQSCQRFINVFGLFNPFKCFFSVCQAFTSCQVDQSEFWKTLQNLVCWFVSKFIAFSFKRVRFSMSSWVLWVLTNSGTKLQLEYSMGSWTFTIFHSCKHLLSLQPIDIK